MHKDRYIGRQPRPYRNLRAMALMFSLAAACSIKSPSAPSWEVVYNLPLLNQWFDITDFMEDEDFAPVGADSIYTVEFEESLERIDVGDSVTLEGLDQSVSESIGNFTVPSSPPQTASISLTALGGPGSSGGVPVPVPALSFSGITEDLPVFDSFTQVVIDTGSVTLGVTNNTRVDFDALGVRLLDKGAGNAVVVTVDVTAGVTLLDGDTRNISTPLDGVTSGNDLIVEIFGHSLADNVTLDGTEGIDIVVTVGELRVSSATAEVGEIDFNFFETVTLTDEATVESATLSSGTLTLTLDNQLPIPLDLTVELPDLTNGGGSPVSLNPVAGPGAQSSVAHPLNDHTLAPGDVGGDKVISVVVNVHSDGSGGGQVTLASTDSVAVQVAITDLVVEWVSGVLDSTTVALPDSSFGLEIESGGNLLDELRKVDLTAVDLEITVRHNIDFPAYLQLNLVGEGGAPDPVELNIAFDLQPSGYTPTYQGDATGARIDSLSLDETNSTVLDFLNAFPTSIGYSGSVTVGNGIYSGSVSSYSWVEADVRFSTPLIIDITEPISIELDKEYSEEGVTELGEGIEIQEATLTYSLASTMGLPLYVQFTAASDSADVYTDPQVELVMALWASAAAAQDTVVTLTSDQWDLLSQPIYTGLRITIPPTGGTPFRVAKSDRLLVRAFVTVQALMKPGEDDGEGGGR